MARYIDVDRDKLFYSNCLIETIKAKIKNPKIKITYISPRINEAFCPHWLWSDGVNDYDFGIEKELKWYQVLWFKGHIRKRNLGFNKKYKSTRKDKNNG